MAAAGRKGAKRRDGRKPSLDKPQLLLIDWLDTASPESSEWKDVDTDTLDGVARVKSTGYLAYKDKTQLIIVQTVSCDGGFFGELAIPRGCITKITRLKYGK